MAKLEAIEIKDENLEVIIKLFENGFESSLKEGELGIEETITGLAFLGYLKNSK